MAFAHIRAHGRAGKAARGIASVSNTPPYKLHLHLSLLPASRKPVRRARFHPLPPHLDEGAVLAAPAAAAVVNPHALGVERVARLARRDVRVQVHPFARFLQDNFQVVIRIVTDGAERGEAAKGMHCGFTDVAATGQNVPSHRRFTNGPIQPLGVIW